ncbi:MAG TPA: monovalent cation/H+ antiporter complex subunit F [Solirubrobacteraceae bacterium]|nr:monovalent cation/H+ antiporter complex subunit F [Solirubrobacteraceae bacterium]
MNPWLIAATILLIALLAPLYVALRRPLMDALIALEVVGVVQSMVLMLLAQGFHRISLMDPALVLAVMSFIGALAYVRLMERRV